MKNSKKLFLLCLIFSLLFGCTKDNFVGFTKVTITGLDLTMRPCSGGYLFKIGNDNYRILDIVDNQILHGKMDELPKTVYIKYEKPVGGCYNENDGVIKVKVTEIKE